MTIDCYCTLGVDREYDLTAEKLLAALDEAGVDRAVIAPTDRHIAVNNREGNDHLLTVARQYAGRFIASCSVNPWYGKEAVAELKRVIAGGARMLILHPYVQGFIANDELVWPILDVAAAERMPVYFHVGPYGSSTPFQVMSLANRYRGVDFIIGHCGATDFWYDVVAATRSAENCYVESSLARPFIFSNFVKQLDSSKGIMGSFAPINDLVFEWEQMRRFLPCPENDSVYGANLLRLLEKRGAL